MTETLYTGPLTTPEHDEYMAQQIPVLTAENMSITYEVAEPVRAVRDVSLVLNLSLIHI